MKKLILSILISVFVSGQATGSPQVVFVRQIAGIHQGCVVATGLTVSGGVACTADDTSLIQTAINAALAAGQTVELIQDAGSAVTSLNVGAGHIKIKCLSKDAGFVSIVGTNRPTIWTGDNCQSSYGTCGTPPAQANNVVIEGCTINATGIAGGQPPNLEPAISLLNLNGIVLQDVDVIGAPSYGYWFTNSSNITYRDLSCTNCLIDGLHWGGLVTNVTGRGFTYLGASSAGGYDDCFDITSVEGYHGADKNFDISEFNCTNVRTFGRVYGYYSTAINHLVSKVRIRSGHGINVTDNLFKLGLESGSTSSGVFPMTLDDIDIEGFSSSDPKTLFVHESFGKIRFWNITSSPANGEFLQIKSQDSGNNITGNLAVLDFQIQRSTTDSTAIFTLQRANVGAITISPSSGIFLKQGYAHTPSGAAFWIDANSSLGFLSGGNTAAIQTDFASPFQTISPAGFAVRIQ